MLNLRFFVMFFFYTAPIAASIIEVTDLESFKKELTTLDKQSLVIFDVDETLITPRDPFFRGIPNLPANCQNILQNFGELDFFLQDEVLKYWKEIWIGKICSKMQFQLVDTEFPYIIQQLQQHAIKTMALTALISKSFGIIPNVADWRIKQLLEFDIDFGHSFPHPILIVNLQNNDLTFKQGILFTTPIPKGEALLGLLKNLGWVPTKIVFIDDRLPCLQSVEKIAENLRISFVGFHYRASGLIPYIFDQKIAALRFGYLAEKGEWLTEDEARLIFSQN